jgi:hypothetical protein
MTVITQIIPKAAIEAEGIGRREVEIEMKIVQAKGALGLRKVWLNGVGLHLVWTLKSNS